MDVIENNLQVKEVDMDTNEKKGKDSEMWRNKLQKCVVAIVIVIVICGSIYRANNPSAPQTNKTSTSVANNSTPKEINITQRDIELRVPSALYETLQEEYVHYDVDLVKTTYKISTVEWKQNANEWVAYGTCTLYTKTGRIEDLREFELHFFKDGRFKSTISRTW